MKKYIASADIGGTTVKLGIFTIEGELTEKWEILTRKEDSGEHILPDIAESLDKKFSEKGINKEEVAGLGIGVPGPVGEDGTVFRCVNLGWGVFNVADRCKELTGLDTKVGNDANVAALGETWKGGGEGYANAVMVTLGTGVGGGIIIDGKIVYGTNGAGGEIGHIPVNEEETEFCGCGKKGCLEQYASATGLVRTAEKLLKKAAEDPSAKASVLEARPYISAKAVCDAAREGDVLAGQAVSESMETLGKALAMIACVLNPQVFIIGGGLAKSGDLLLSSMTEAFKKNTFWASKETTFELAKLGNLAGIYGAAKLVIS